MLWSNWQGAIWRGAMVVLLLWSGLAWTQTPVQPPAAAPERIMVVHENGKSVRCRVLESWQLPDRRVAHLLQAVEGGEMITIVDDQVPTGDADDVKNVRSMAKRIFSWGSGRRTPPEGSPVPPHLRMDSGLVLTNENAPPSDAVQTPGPAIVNRVVDEKALGGAFGSHPDGTIRLTNKEPSKNDPQVVEFNPPIPATDTQGNPLLPIPQVQSLTPTVSGEPCPPTTHEMVPGTFIEPAKKSWRPGDKLQAWLLNKSASRPIEVAKLETPAAPKKTETAMPMTTLPSPSSDTKKTDAAPLAISKPADDKAIDSAKPGPEKRDIWGSAPPTPAKTDETSKKPEPKVDPLFAPERITPKDDKLKGKMAMIAPPAPQPNEQWPLNAQSVLAAKSGMQGPVIYVPYPMVTVPAPHQPPMPPDPRLPEAPQLNAFVNAFSPPPMPKGQANPSQPSMMPQGNPMLAQQQQMMQQQMMQQQMMAQANMMPYGDPRMAYMPQQGANPMMMAQYRQQMMPQGPMSNGMRQYQGPMQAGYAPSPYGPMMMPPQQQQPMMQPVSYQQPMPAQQSPVTQQIDQLIRAMRESPYPAQREWAAQQLLNFDWRANPQILFALLQSAGQDPAVSVRAGCVYCIGRSQASIEPVLGALNAMRNDTEPRVRQEVEQALARLAQTPVAAR